MEPFAPGSTVTVKRSNGSIASARVQYFCQEKQAYLLYFTDEAGQELKKYAKENELRAFNQPQRMASTASPRNDIQRHHTPERRGGNRSEDFSTPTAALAESYAEVRGEVNEPGYQWRSSVSASKPTIQLNNTSKNQTTTGSRDSSVATSAPPVVHGHATLIACNSAKIAPNPSSERVHATGSSASPENADKSSGEKFVCDLCEFEARSAGGLKNHYNKRTCQLAVIKRRRAKAVADENPTAEPLDKLLRRLRRDTVVLKHVPRGARRAVADSLSSVIGQCLKKNDTDSWTRLLTFAFTALRRPDGCNKSNKLSEAVKGNLAFVEDPSHERQSVASTKSSKPKQRNAEEAAVSAASFKIQDGDVGGAVRLLSSEDGIAPDNEHTYQQLLEKHPSAPVDVVFPAKAQDETASTHQVTIADVRQALLAFPNGSSGGLCALRPQHLKELMLSKTESSCRLIESVAKLTEVILCGKVPEEIVPYLHGASLTALAKKDGGIRPIAVGNTIRRLASKIVSKRVMERMGALLRPVQLGCGTRGGAEAAVHYTRFSMNESSGNVKVLLKVDYVNAFNTIRRDKIIEEVESHMPEFLPFVEQLYKKPTHLFYGDRLLSSETGVQQGDPLGPLLFCLVIRKLTLKMTSPLNIWYLDDGTIGGDPESVKKDLILLSEESALLGLKLNVKKCEVLTANGSNDADARRDAEQLLDFSEELLTPAKNEYRLLGSALNSESVAGLMREKTKQLKRLTARLPKLPAHQAMFLLKNCLGIPKVIYAMRTSLIWNQPETTRKFDDIMRASLAEITNVCMTQEVWDQATLPIRYGGLGLRAMEKMSLPAFLASIYSVMPVISELRSDVTVHDLAFGAVEQWAVVSRSDYPEAAQCHYQRTWDNLLCEESFKNLMETADMEKKARLLSVSSKNAGAWLNALPSPVIGNLLDNDCTRIAVALRLGAETCQPHICELCGTPVDALGQRGLSCASSAGRQGRHSTINDVICRSLISAGVSAEREPSGLFINNQKRPDGITLQPWSEGKYMAWDATIVDPLALSNLISASETPAQTAKDAEESKRQKYVDLGNNIIFYPVGLETLGAFGPSAEKLITEIGRRLAVKTGQPRSTEFLRQRISIEIQRGNAISVKATLPQDSELEEIYHVLSKK